jgi:hypothetical protein
LLLLSTIVGVCYLLSTKKSCNTVDFTSSPLTSLHVLENGKAEISKTAEPTTQFNAGIKKIFLLGERNTDTNYIEETLWRAFPSYGREGAKSLEDQPFASGIPVIDFHKDTWRRMLTKKEKENLTRAASDAVWLLAVQNPNSWADGMIGHIGTYTDLFELRRHKLEVMKTITELFPHRTRIINLHEFELNPHATVQAIVQQFKLQVCETYWVLPAEPSKMIHKEDCLSEEEWKIAQTHIDWKMEGHFGFTPLDCHVCVGEESLAIEDSPAMDS